MRILATALVTVVIAATAYAETQPVCAQKVVSKLVRQADVVAVSQVKSVGKPPGYWSGIISAHQSVNYTVVSLLKGHLPATNISVVHLVVANDRTADKEYPQLSPTLFHPGGELLLFLHARTVSLPSGNSKLLIDVLPEDCSVVLADPSTIVRTRAVLARNSRMTLPPILALRSVQKYVAVIPEPHNIRAQGIVALHVTVGADGRVSNIRMLSGHPILVPKAIDAVRQWEFKPVRRGGVASEFQFELRVPVKNSAPTSLEDVQKVNSGKAEAVDTRGVMR